MGALPWICALQFGAVLCSFEGSEPIHDGEPPAVRGDAPRGLFTPRWVEPQGREVKFTSTDFLILSMGFSPGRHGTGAR